MAQNRKVSLEQTAADWTSESPLGRFATGEACSDAGAFLAYDQVGMTAQALKVTAAAIMP